MPHNRTGYLQKILNWSLGIEPESVLGRVAGNVDPSVQVPALLQGGKQLWRMGAKEQPFEEEAPTVLPRPPVPPTGLYGTNRERLTSELAPKPVPLNPFSSTSLDVGVEGEGLLEEPKPTSKLWWEWSGGGNEPPPEESQQWLQRAGAGTTLPQPLSSSELSAAAYQFPNVPHIQETWGIRKAEALAASNRAQQALNALQEAETGMSPLVSAYQERQAQREAYPQAAYAGGLTRQAQITGEYAKDRAEIEAEQAFNEMTVEALSRGPEAAKALLQELYPAWAEMGEYTTLDKEGQRIRTQLEKAIQLLLPKALEGLAGAGVF